MTQIESKIGHGEKAHALEKWTYKLLRNFIAGMESGISWLKRSFGLSIYTWKGYESFKSYIGLSIVSANLLTLAMRKFAAA